MKMAEQKLSMAELKNKSLSFDRADVRDVHVIKNQDDYLCKDVMGVWNLDKNVLACLAPKNYTVIQHKEAAEALIETITSLNIKATAELQTSKHGIFLDIDFPDVKVELTEVGESFTSGLHLVNDYSLQGLVIAPRLTRLICTNGMIISEIVRSKKIRWSEQLKVELEGVVDNMLKEIISSDQRLINMVSICMKDSVEWQTAKLLAKELFKRKKYAKEIMARCTELNEGRVNRWQFYNAITSFLGVASLKPAVEAWFQNKAQKVMKTSFNELCEIELPQKEEQSI